MNRNDEEDAVLASSIADDEPIEWRRLEAETAGDPWRLKLLRAFKVIQRVGRTHDRLFPLGAATLATTVELTPAELESWRHLQILGKVGEGSFGEVYQARDPRLDRVVALKLLREAGRGADSSSVVEEGRLLARVKHPNVATVYGAARDGDRVGVWMEFVRGETLSAILDRHGPFGAREATLIGIDLCAAVAAVHARKILHRDIKAQNVMREEGGRIVLMDFGIGSDQRAAPAREGISGTPLYMAPEVLRGEGATAASDIYSLGVLLFHLVTARFPVEGRSIDELRELHREPHRLLRDARPDLSRSYVAAVERALAPVPAERYVSAGEMERALIAALVENGQERHADGSGRVGPAVRYAAIAVVLAALLLAGYAWQRDAPGEAQQLYELALRKRAQEGLDPAIALLRRAIELDEGFALAHATLADFYEGAGRYEEALRAADLADEHCCSGLSEIDSALVQGTVHSTRMQMREAIEAFGYAAETQNDPELWRKKAEAQAILGRDNAALDSTRRALALEPDHLLTRGWLVLLLGMTKQYDDAFSELSEGRGALARLQQSDSTIRDYPYFYWGEGVTYLVRDDPALGDLESAGVAFDSLGRGGPTFVSYGRLFKAQWFAYQGRLRDAANELEDSLPLDTQEGLTNSVAMRLNRLAQLYALLGDEEQALRKLKEVETLKDIPTYVENLREAGLLYVALDELEGASLILRRLERIERDYPSDFSESFTAQIAGEIANRSGDTRSAEELLESARTTLGDPLTVLSWARFLVQERRFAEAERNLKRLLSAKGRILQWHSATVWALAHLELARCQVSLAAESAGDLAAAADKYRDAGRNYERFLALWRTADPELVDLVAAREELERLP